MNKWQIICPLVAMALVAAVLFAISGAAHNRAFLVGQTRSLGAQLIARTNSPQLLLQPYQRERLGQLLSHRTFVAQVKTGDQPKPLGDGRASSWMVLSNAQGAQIVLRLRRADNGEFHLLSFR